MALGIYAGTSADNLTLLPSPVSVKPSKEQIWSENTGRAQSGANKAKMVGDSITEKITYQIHWGILTPAEMKKIESKLKRGFFTFGIGTTASEAKANAGSYYRSEIQSDIITTLGGYYYKDAQVTVIEQ